MFLRLEMDSKFHLKPQPDRGVEEYQSRVVLGVKALVCLRLILNFACMVHLSSRSR